jgi:hypothetical protein
MTSYTCHLHDPDTLVGRPPYGGTGTAEEVLASLQQGATRRVAHTRAAVVCRAHGVAPQMPFVALSHLERANLAEDVLAWHRGKVPPHRPTEIEHEAARVEAAPLPTPAVRTATGLLVAATRDDAAGWRWLHLRDLDGDPTVCGRFHVAESRIRNGAIRDPAAYGFIPRGALAAYPDPAPLPVRVTFEGAKLIDWELAEELAKPNSVDTYTWKLGTFGAVGSPEAMRVGRFPTFEDLADVPVRVDPVSVTLSAPSPLAPLRRLADALEAPARLEDVCQRWHKRTGGRCVVDWGPGGIGPAEVVVTFEAGAWSATAEVDAELDDDHGEEVFASQEARATLDRMTGRYLDERGTLDVARRGARREALETIAKEGRRR